MDCPCQSGRLFDACCGPLLSGQSPAATPEALMRSRYTAFARGEMDYLRNSLVPEHREEFSAAETLRWNKDTVWLGLDILETATEDDRGMVLFRCSYRHKGVTQDLTERSRFERRDGRWLYLDGEHEQETKRNAGPKVGRNDPCPCGSGKKFKKCCG